MSSNKQSATTLWQRIKRNMRYCINGVWNDTKGEWPVKALKIINLSVRTFMDRDLQLRAGALTYNTVLAIIPALAMIFAIARGFGFQNLMQSELFRYFPAQRQALESALAYVDNYLAQASQGVFIGIGLIFLLWTLISLMSNVEDTFNYLWHVNIKRSLRHKFTDYTTLFLLLPILMVCSAGISIFMSDAVQVMFADNALSPMMHRLLAFMPIVISWIIFTAAYYFVPNTKVRFLGALFAGVLCGTFFEVVQWLFVSGQVYVSKYNAIYGSFAFLPLLLIWLQLSWLIALSGVVLSYSWQNYDSYAHRDKVNGISQTYANNVAVAVLALAAKKFKLHDSPLTRAELMREYDIPGLLADRTLERLVNAGLLITVVGHEADGGSYNPAFDPDEMTVNKATNDLADTGYAHFIPKADSRFAALLDRVAAMRDNQQNTSSDIPLLDLL